MRGSACKRWQRQGHSRWESTDQPAPWAAAEGGGEGKAQDQPQHHLLVLRQGGASVVQVPRKSPGYGKGKGTTDKGGGTRDSRLAPARFRDISSSRSSSRPRFRITAALRKRARARATRPRCPAYDSVDMPDSRLDRRAENSSQRKSARACNPTRGA